MTPVSNKLGFITPSMRIYCYKGRPKYIPHIFHTVSFSLDIETDDFVQYVGSTPDEVESHRDNQKSIFSLNWGFSHKRNLELHPFNQTCVGVETSEPYKVNLHLIRIDFYKVFFSALAFSSFTQPLVSAKMPFSTICAELLWEYALLFCFLFTL